MSSPQPWQAVTPEAQLPRSDSRAAMTTCRGICSNGKACRRPLASPASRRRSSTAASPVTPLASPLYCWQHQSQAPQADVQPKPNTKPLNHQTSVDTLVERFGVLGMSEKKPRRGDENLRPDPRRGNQKRPRRPGLFALLCCGGSSLEDDDNYYEVVRHKKRIERSEKQSVAVSSPQQAGRTSIRSHPPQTSGLIPGSLPDETAALLQLELAKPLSIADEPGYIYMFWITEDQTPPISQVAESTFDGNGPQGKLPQGLRNQRDFTVKIGRATNVHRRMSSWSRQCGYTLSLLRFYPHVPSSPGTVRHSGSIRKAPYSHRVERLIHIELAGRRVQQGECGSCGRAHREWFSVDASREGVREIDAVIQRWVSWAESHAPA